MPTRPAAFTAATRVVWSFEWIAFSTMFFDGYIGAPPTILVGSLAKLGSAVAPKARLSAAAPAKANEVRRFMGCSLLFCPRGEDIGSYGAALRADARLAITGP